MKTNYNQFKEFLIKYKYHIIAFFISILSGIIVLFLSFEVFPYHSSNHDEGVYLQQAAMLLEGQIRLYTGFDAFKEAIHPWFFIEDGNILYPKYTPVPAAIFAIGKLFGSYRLSLFFIGIGNTFLVYKIVSATFNRYTGVIASSIFTISPLFLISSSVFLPYASTTFLNLLFAFSYIKAIYTNNIKYAIISGIGIGLAFFSRPYTAILFAIPFILHSIWKIFHHLSLKNIRKIRQYTIIGFIGLLFVFITLIYNNILTGSPFLFPYEAFAPLDSIGFGERNILGHEIFYTPLIGIQSNIIVLQIFFTQWFAGGIIGSIIFFIGTIISIIQLIKNNIDFEKDISQNQIQLILFGIIISVIVGNIYFWGNFNILSGLEDPNNGLISLFGPFYHFDLLLPMSTFTAYGVVKSIELIKNKATRYLSKKKTITGIYISLLVMLTLVVGIELSILGGPISNNLSYTEKYEKAYEPFQDTNLNNSLVFLPTTYGEWRNHPFQWLRNDPGFDDDIVYVLNRNPQDNFLILDKYPNRSLYRYRYNGVWNNDPDNRVIPILEHVRVYRNNEIPIRTVVSIPERVIHVTVGVSNEDKEKLFDYNGNLSNQITLDWIINQSEISILNSNLSSLDNTTSKNISISNIDEVKITVTLTDRGGATLTYQEEIDVRIISNKIEVIWPPESSVCTLTRECGLSETYIHNRSDIFPEDIEMNTEIIS